MKLPGETKEKVYLTDKTQYVSPVRNTSFCKARGLRFNNLLEIIP